MAEKVKRKKRGRERVEKKDVGGEGGNKTKKKF